MRTGLTPEKAQQGAALFGHSPEPLVRFRRTDLGWMADSTFDS